MKLNKINDRLDLVLKSFPEISKEKIKILFNKGNRCMSAQPTLFLLFKRRKNRTYIITISKKEPYKSFIESLSFEALDGWLAHELSHLIFYEKMTDLELIMFALKYVLNYKFRKKIENRTDIETLRRGFSKELIEGIKAIENSSLSKKYKKYLQEYYLTSDEINRYKIICDTTETASTLIGYHVATQ